MDNCPKRCQCGETESLSRSHDGTVAHFGCERRCVVQGDEWVWESASATCLRKQLARLEAEVERLNNARMATMHVLRTTGLGNSQERLDKAMEILNSVEEGE